MARLDREQDYSFDPYDPAEQGTRGDRDVPKEDRIEPRDSRLPQLPSHEKRQTPPIRH